MEDIRLIIELGFVLLKRDSHVEEEQLEQYSIGALPEPDVARVEEHILICETCQEKLAHADSWIRSVRRVSTEFQPAPRRFWHTWALPRFVPVLAASVVLVLVAGLAVQFHKRVPLAPLAVVLEGNRGAVNVATIPASQPLLLQPDVTGLPPFSQYRLEVVNDTGKRVWRQTVAATSAGTPAANISQIAHGAYFVRLYSPAGELLREYALEVRNPQ
jgi:hypothetical protein